MRSFLLCSALFLPLSAFAYDCEFTRNIEQTVDVESISELVVNAGAGSLHISGREGSNKIVIEAMLCAGKKSDLDAMDVSARKRSDRVVIKTEMPDSSGWNSWGKNEHKSIDLTLRVPARMVLKVDDSSGLAEIENVAGLEIDDSSGALRVANIRGDVKIDDSSGAIEVDDVSGSVQINDSSGGIRAREIGKNLYIESDSSGEIDGRGIGGDFIVDEDSSGRISAIDVKGDFIVRRDGSGGIDYRNIGGNVEIPERKRKH